MRRNVKPQKPRRRKTEDKGESNRQAKFNELLALAGTTKPATTADVARLTIDKLKGLILRDDNKKMACEVCEVEG